MTAVVLKARDLIRRAFRMATMNVDKLDVPTYLATAASSSPASLQPYFEKFRTQYDRRYVDGLFEGGTI